MLIESNELLVLLALIIMSNEGLYGAEGHVLEWHLLFLMKNELLDEFVGSIGITHHQLSISGEKQHAVVTRLSTQCVFFQTRPVGLLHALIDAPLLVRFEKCELNWVITHIHPLPTPSQVESELVLHTRNALRNAINNARLIDKISRGLDAYTLE